MTESNCDESVRHFISDFKGHFGLKVFPLEVLGTGDDWTLVIKLHGFVEISLNRLLETYFGLAELKKVIEKLPTAHPKNGKLAFVKALQLLPERGCLFVTKISELRGMLSHDIGKLDFDLKKYFADLPHGERDSWARALWWWKEKAPEEFLDPGQPLGSIEIATLKLMIYAFLRNTERADQPDQRKGDNSPESSPT